MRGDSVSAAIAYTERALSTSPLLPPFGNFEEPNLQQSAAYFRAQLDDLKETQYGLAKRLEEFGDTRAFMTILRGIQRIALAENRIPGEIQAFLNVLKRDRHRAREDCASIQWQTLENGAISGQARGYHILLGRERAGWRVTVRHIASGVTHPWPKFPETEEDAKIKAMICIDEAIRAFHERAKFSVFDPPPS